VKNSFNDLFIGLSTVSDAGVNVDSNGDSILYRIKSGVAELSTTGGGSSTAVNSPQGTFPNTKKDITVEYDGTQVNLLVDGDLQGTIQFSFNGDFSPVIQRFDSSNDSFGEFIEVGQITVEPIGGTF
jgi:hypothetical protein